MEHGSEVSFAVQSLYEALQQVTDKRKARGKRYLLAVLLTILVLGKLSGEDEIEGIAEWGQLRVKGHSRIEERTFASSALLVQARCFCAPSLGNAFPFVFCHIS